MRATKLTYKKAQKDPGSTIENLYEQGLKSANEWMEEGKSKLKDSQEFLKDQSTELVQTIKSDPVPFWLVASGICFFIAAYLFKK